MDRRTVGVPSLRGVSSVMRPMAAMIPENILEINQMGAIGVEILPRWSARADGWSCLDSGCFSDGALDLKVGEAEALYRPTEVGTGQVDEDMQLSTLVGKLDERFGTEFTSVFNKQLENLLVERMGGNEEISVRLMNDEAFRDVAAGHLMRAVYQQARAGRLL
jgi:hypothetical protein